MIPPKKANIIATKKERELLLGLSTLETYLMGEEILENVTPLLLTISITPETLSKFLFLTGLSITILDFSPSSKYSWGAEYFISPFSSG